MLNADNDEYDAAIETTRTPFLFTSYTVQSGSPGRQTAGHLYNFKIGQSRHMN